MSIPSNTKYIVIIFCSFFLFITKSFGQKGFSRDTVVSIMSEKHLPGLFISVIQGDNTRHYSYGFADIHQDKELLTEHTLKIGSVSKPLTALAILKLVEQGNLNLDTNIEERFPEIPIVNPYSETQPVRLHHLLEHKAGFDDMHFAAFENKLNRIATAEEELETHINSLEVRWEPGLVHSYSNSGYVTLGYIIEKVSGEPYTKFIQEHFLNPLKMSNTFYYEDQHEGIAKAHGYYWQDGYNEVGNFRLMGQSAGGLWSNGKDLTKLLRLYLNNGIINNDTILNPRFFKEIETLHGLMDKKSNIETGYGLGMRSYLLGGDYKHHFWGHSGGIIGFGAHIIYNRDLDLAIAVGNNGQSGNKAVLNYLVRKLTKNEKVINGKLEFQLSNIKLKPWEGTYLMKNSRNQLFRFVDALTATISIDSIKSGISVKPFLKEDFNMNYAGINSFKKLQSSSPTLYLGKYKEEPVLIFENDLYEKVSPFLIWFLRILLVMALLSIPYFIIVLSTQIIRLAIGNTSMSKFLKTLSLGVPHILTVLYFVFFFSLIPLQNISQAGDFNFRTLAIFIISLTIPVSIIFNAYLIVIKKNNDGIKAPYAIISLTTAVIIASYMGYYNLLGLALWNY